MKRQRQAPRRQRTARRVPPTRRRGTGQTTHARTSTHTACTRVTSCPYYRTAQRAVKPTECSPPLCSVRLTGKRSAVAAGRRQEPVRAYGMHKPCEQPKHVIRNYGCCKHVSRETSAPCPRRSRRGGSRQTAIKRRATVPAVQQRDEDLRGRHAERLNASKMLNNHKPPAAAQPAAAPPQCTSEPAAVPVLTRYRADIRPLAAPECRATPRTPSTNQSATAGRTSRHPATQHGRCTKRLKYLRNQHVAAVM